MTYFKNFKDAFSYMINNNEKSLSVIIANAKAKIKIINIKGLKKSKYFDQEYFKYLPYFNSCPEIFKDLNFIIINDSFFKINRVKIIIDNNVYDLYSLSDTTLTSIRIDQDLKNKLEQLKIIDDNKNILKELDIQEDEAPKKIRKI